jgi:hypothetical protein
MFCGEQDFAACGRPWEVQAAAAGVRLERRLQAKATRAAARPTCCSAARSRAPTSALRLAPGATAIAYGRLLSEPAGRKLGAPIRLMPPATLDAGILRRCAAGPDGRRLSDDDWEKCKGGAVVDVVAEGWGQGHARASVARRRRA